MNEPHQLLQVGALPVDDNSVSLTVGEGGQKVQIAELRADQMGLQ
jgi:hypothetical protein